jgi:hypothetical protein
MVLEPEALLPDALPLCPLDEELGLLALGLAF